MIIIIAAWRSVNISNGNWLRKLDTIYLDKQAFPYIRLFYKEI